MSFENKAEQVGVLSPYSMNPNDIGKSWKDIGAISAQPIGPCSYLGNGIVIIGDGFDGHLYRSVDYGLTWVDLGIISTSIFGFDYNSSAYLGNGIVLVGDSDGHIFRSTNFGLNWTDLGVIATGSVARIIYLGNGIAVIADLGSAFLRSTDFGLNWTNLGFFGFSNISALYLDEGIAIIGDASQTLFRSVDYGATWTNLGNVIGTGDAYGLEYLGNGIVIVGNAAGHVFRSTDYGLTWTDLGAITASSLNVVLYLGDGIVILGTSASGHIFRSMNYGLTWTDLGAITAEGIFPMSYLGSGIVIFGTTGGHIWRSDISYKLDEVMPSVSVGMSSGIGNTVGTSGLAYQRLVIAGGNNITLSQSVSSGSATLTISAGTGSGGGTNVTVFQPAQGMDITDSGVNLNSQSVNFYRVSMPASIVATEYDIIGDMRLASNSIGAYTLSYGVYTMTGSTANLASSTSVSSVFASGSQTSASSRYGGQSGMRYRSVSLASWNFVPGEYLFAMGYLRLGNVSMELVGPHRQSVLGIPGGGNYSKYFYDGAISSAGAFLALPSSVHLSAITRTGDNLHVWWMALAGTF